MRILIVHSEVTKQSGSGRYFYDLASGLSEKGFSVQLLAYRVDSSLNVCSNLKITQVKKMSSPPFLWRFSYLLQLVHLLHQIKSKLALSDFDILIGSDLLFCKAIMTTCGRDKKFIYTPLSMIAPIEIESYGFKGIYRKFSIALFKHLQHWALLECDKCVRFTPSSVKALEKYYQLPLKQKTMVGVFVSREFEKRDNDHLPWLKKKKSNEILWVGRLIKSKNVEFIIRAVSLLKSKNWFLNICSEGPEKATLKQLSKELGMDEKIRFLGYVEDLSEVYRRSSIFVTASLLEQYSLTIMEAYQHGLPCIGLKPDWKHIFNSNEDQIIDGVTGFIISNEEEMAKRIDYLIENKKKRIEMGRNAYLFKNKNYSFEDYINKFIKNCLETSE